MKYNPLPQLSLTFFFKAYITPSHLLLRGLVISAPFLFCFFAESDKKIS